MLSITFGANAIQTTMDANRLLFGLNPPPRNWDTTLNQCRMLVANAIQLLYLLQEGGVECPDKNGWLNQNQLAQLVNDYNGYTRRISRDLGLVKFSNPESSKRAQELSAWFLNVYAVNNSSFSHDTEYIRYALMHPELVPVYGQY